MEYDKTLVGALLIVLILSSLGDFGFAQHTEEKIQTEDIILIHNVYELQNISKNLSGHYALVNDINATITKTWNGGAGFIPIGNYSDPFNGTFDGRGYTITGLFINSTFSYIGLFGYTSESAVIENVSLVNINVSAVGDYGGEVGGLVGYNVGTVNESSVRGNVRAIRNASDAGGLVGVNNGIVRDSYATGSVSGGEAGGLVGYNEGTVDNSHYNANTTLINGGHYLTIGAMYDTQFKNWISHGMKLNISNYPSLVLDGGYYDISSVQGLKDMLGFAEDGLKFKLTANMDLSSYPDFYIPYFNGTFDGNNHTISNLEINISFSQAVGLIGINKGTVENVGVINVNVSVGSGGGYVGGLIGENGLIIDNEGIVDNSYATGKVNASTSWPEVGGLVGGNYGTVRDSYATVSVNGGEAGGLVGLNCGAVTNSYSTGDVSGNSRVGGLIGVNDGTVNNSYATGNVNGRGYEAEAGGLVGVNNGVVSNSYATGNVGSFKAGGLIGENDWGMVTASFWNINTSEMIFSDGGVGKTTAEMMNEFTFLGAGWDFTNTWAIVDGKTYPYLKWQHPSRPSAPLYLTAMNGTGYINLTWINPSFDGATPITEYKIYRNGTLIATVRATQLWYNDTNVVNEQSYTYYITAVNAAGESPRSNEVRAMSSGTVTEFPQSIIIVILLLLLIGLILAVLRKRKN